MKYMAKLDPAVWALGLVTLSAVSALACIVMVSITF